MPCKSGRNEEDRGKENKQLISRMNNKSNGKSRLGLIFAIVGTLLAGVSASFAQSWTSRAVAPEDEASGWGLNCVACSADGSVIVAGSFGGPICVSTNWGVTWQANSPNEDWDSVASSADGTKLVGVCTLTDDTNGYGDSTIFTSTDSGTTWTAQNWTTDTNHFINWAWVASSADGSKLVALATPEGGFSSSDPARANIGIYLSTDSGVSWQLSAAQIPTNSWEALASSADGTTLAAAGFHVDFTLNEDIQSIYVSRDSGATWVAGNAPNVNWRAIAMSADGSKMVAVTVPSPGQIYTSSDYGQNWTLQTNAPSQPSGWDAVASSADGTRLVAGGADSNGRIYTSLDSGVTWASTNNEPTRESKSGIKYAGWMAVASSSDGLNLVGVPYNIGDIYTLQAPLYATILATPARVQTSNTIQVVMSVADNGTNGLSSVQLNGPLTVAGSGGVSPAESVGPTSVSLAPGTSVSFTNLYTATNYGTVTFSGSATGTGADGVLISPVTTSGVVQIAPLGDLLIKLASQTNAPFAGAGIYQTVPIGPQVISSTIESNETSRFLVEVVNNESTPQDYTLVAVEDSNPGWTFQYTLGTENVTASLESFSGMQLPTLAPGASLTLAVNMTASNVVAGTEEGVVFTLGLVGYPSLTLDAVQAITSVAQVPVTLTLHRVQATGFTQSSMEAGLTDITAPLQLVSDFNVLGAQPQISGGLVADEVTPLLVEVQADASALAPFPTGRTFKANITLTDGGALNGAQPNATLQVLDPATGLWATNSTFTLFPTNTTAYLWVAPLASDNVQLESGAQQLQATLQILDTNTAASAGEVSFAICKPPIFLLHGYNTTGDWGQDFQNILATTRPMTTPGDPNNFVVTVRYGQQNAPAYATNMPWPVSQNTAFSLADCAVLANTALTAAEAPILSNWAMTRFDVVAHSQGGLLARMLCSANANNKITEPFRNPDNFFRGRFHRVVTIGSPHNGTRLLYYLFSLAQNINNATSNPNPFSPNSPLGGAVAVVTIYSQVAQAKFDPFGPQIQDLNNPSPGGNWYPDPAAQFHLVRAVIDGGRSPAQGDQNVMAYTVLDLASPGGGQAVIPRGSDGVVDYDSMAANVPPAALAPNVYDIPPNNAISHAGPLFFFGAQAFETASTVIAQHVIDTLDQNGNEPAANTQFGSFPLPPLLDPSVRAGIDKFASNLLYIAPSALIVQQLDSEVRQSPAPQGGSQPLQPVPHEGSMNVTAYSYSLNFPGDEPPQGDVEWLAEVYGPAGVTTNGINWSAQGTNDEDVTVDVTNGLVGDVVLYAYYQNTSNQIVLATGQLVVSQPPVGATLTGIGLLPYNPDLPVGTSVPVQLIALYSDGSSSMRYVTSDAVTAVSSNPSVVTVTNSLQWQLLSPGSAEVVVSWAGFSVTNEVTAFVSGSTSPTLALTNNGASFSLNWPLWASGFTLEYNTNLNSSDWQPVTEPPATNNQQLTLALPFSTSPQFFRLER